MRSFNQSDRQLESASQIGFACLHLTVISLVIVAGQVQ